MCRKFSSSYLSSSGRLESGAFEQELKDRPDQLSLESADRVPPALPVGPLASDVDLGRFVSAGLDEGDDVEGPVELAVATAVEPHPLDLARAGRDGGDAGEVGEGIGRPEPGDVAEQLEKLRDLRDKGVLTDEAYEEARERLRRY